MVHRSQFWAALFFVLVFTSAVVLAQDNSCPTLVQTALSAVDQACQATGRNQACYGNFNLNAEPQPDITTLQLDNPGDIANVTDIKSLQLSPMDEAQNLWGIALMKLQANLPDTLPGQNVIFLMFGDVQIETAVDPNAQPASLNVTPVRRLNVREGPSSGDKLLERLATGETVVANPRLQDGTWLRISLPNGQAGWVSAEFVTADGDTSALSVVEPSDNTVHSPFRPMQAFYFKSGVADAPCPEAPNSGLLVQSPQDAGRVFLTVNGVDIQLGSTVYFQAEAGNEMTVSVIEGFARGEAFGTAVVATAGARFRVPLDENLHASAAPFPPEPFVVADLHGLPLDHLTMSVTVPAPLPPEQIIRLVKGVPLTGQWEYTRFDCPANNEGVGSIFTLTMDVDGESLIWGEAKYNHTTANIYLKSDGRWTLRISPDRLEFTRTDGCFVAAELRTLGTQ